MSAVPATRDEREIGRLITVVLAVGCAVALVALVTLRTRTPQPPPPWVPADGPAFHVELPVQPTTRSLAPGTGESTAVVGETAYVVVWYPVPAGTPPLGALRSAVTAIGRAPAQVLTARVSLIGAFAAVDTTIRLARDNFFGRVLVAGDRGYLVGEITPVVDPPPDLNRLLRGFDPT